MGRLVDKRKNTDAMIELLASFLPMLLEGAPVLVNLIKSLDTTARPRADSSENSNSVDPQNLANLISQFASIYPELMELLKMGGENDG